jgi:hypothetical protein
MAAVAVYSRDSSGVKIEAGLEVGVNVAAWCGGCGPLL